MPFEHENGDSTPKVNPNWKSIGQLAREAVEEAAKKAAERNG